MQTSIHKKSRQPDTVYATIDIDNFSSQIFSAYNICKPKMPFVVICQSIESHRSMVWSVSSGARDCGIECGMPVSYVKKRHPDIEIFKRNCALEKKISHELCRVMERFSPDLEIISTSTFLLDLTATPVSRKLPWYQIGEHIRQCALTATGLTYISVGISRTIFISRICAKKARPDNILICKPEDEEHLLNELQCCHLPGLSAHSKAKLKKYGIQSLSQLKNIGQDAILRRFGPEGEKLYAISSGLHVKPKEKPFISVHAETVLDRDINDLDMLLKQVNFLADKFCHQLKKNNACIKRFTMLLIYSDNKRTQKTVSLHVATSDFLTISNCAASSFSELYKRRIAIKSLTLTSLHTERETGQLDLFETAWNKKQKLLSEGIVRVRNRFQFKSVISGTNV